MRVEFSERPLKERNATRSRRDRERGLVCSQTVRPSGWYRPFGAPRSPSHLRTALPWLHLNLARNNVASRIRLRPFDLRVGEFKPLCSHERTGVSRGSSCLKFVVPHVQCSFRRRFSFPAASVSYGPQATSDSRALARVPHSELLQCPGISQLMVRSFGNYKCDVRTWRTGTKYRVLTRPLCAARLA